MYLLTYAPSDVSIHSCECFIPGHFQWGGGGGGGYSITAVHTHICTSFRPVRPVRPVRLVRTYLNKNGFRTIPFEKISVLDLYLYTKV